jgi:thioesterase domain-containing protein
MVVEDTDHLPERDMDAEAGRQEPSVLEVSVADPVSPELVARVPILVLNRGGSLPPLFCICTWTEEMENYRRLARRLGPDQPLYSVNPPTGSKPSDFPGDIDQWADWCIERLGSLVECESMALAGWSFGGVVALRVAEKLEERGVDVRVVNLFDSTMPRRKPRGDDRKRSELHRFAVAFEQLFQFESVGARALFVQRYLRKLSKRLFKKARRGVRSLRHLGRSRAPAGLPEIESPAGALNIRNGSARKQRKPLLMRAIRIAYLKYQVRPTSIPVVLYWCEESRSKVGDASLGWSTRLRGSFHSHQIHGVHRTLFEEPQVGLLAQRLERALRHSWETPTLAAAPGAELSLEPAAAVPVSSGAREVGAAARWNRVDAFPG